MKNYSFGDVLLVSLPQTAASGPKIRPVVVILDIGDDDLVIVPMTSVHRAGPGDLQIAQWKQAGLNVPSYARLAKTSLILKTASVRRVGRLTVSDRRKVSDGWRSLYDLKP